MRLLPLALLAVACEAPSHESAMLCATGEPRVLELSHPDTGEPITDGDSIELFLGVSGGKGLLLDFSSDDGDPERCSYLELQLKICHDLTCRSVDSQEPDGEFRRELRRNEGTMGFPLPQEIPIDEFHWTPCELSMSVDEGEVRTARVWVGGEPPPN